MERISNVFVVTSAGGSKENKVGPKEWFAKCQ